ncbi:MAG: glycosyltransferase [Patescibacteria group bacterium]
MKLLFLSSDRKIFDTESAVSSRMEKYASLVDTLTVMVFTKSSHEKKREIRGNLFLIPTNSKSRWSYIFDAISIGKKLSGIDLISAQDPFESGLTALYLARKLNAKLEIQIHTDFLSPYFSKESLLNRVRVSIARYTLPKADGVRVVSRRIVHSLQKKGTWTKRPPVVLPVYGDLSKYKNASRGEFLKEKYPQFDFHVLVASRLSPEKNLSAVFKDFAKAMEKFPKMGLIVVGDGEQKESLHGLAKKLGAKESIIFEGWINDLSPYFLSADLFVSASFYEGFGLSLLEAASSGCSILSTDVGIVGDILKPEHLFLSGFKEEEIYSTLLSALQEEERRISSQSFLREDVSSFLALDQEEYFQKFILNWKSLLEANTESSL